MVRESIEAYDRIESKIVVHLEIGIKSKQNECVVCLFLILQFQWHESDAWLFFKIVTWKVEDGFLLLWLAFSLIFMQIINSFASIHFAKVTVSVSFCKLNMRYVNGVTLAHLWLGIAMPSIHWFYHYNDIWLLILALLDIRILISL